MLNLDELVFKVNTEALVDATNKVANLGKVVNDLSTNFSKLERNSSSATKAQAKADKDAASAELDRAKAAEVLARTEERKSKAIKDTTKATEDATSASKAQVSILERQQTILEFQANGFSKGQASILAYAKAAGVAAEEIKEIGKVLQAQRTLMGGDPFDKSLGSLKSLQNEFKTLKEVQRLYTAEIPLTRKQMENLALDKMRLIEAMKIEGRSLKDIKNAIRDLNVEYITTAGNINRVVKAEDALDRARKDAASANTFLEKEMQRVNFALQTQNNELNKGTTNALNRFEQNLKRSGLTLDQQRVKLEEYRKGLLALEKTKGGNTDYITRALGPQITDIFVGLATGQAPLTVMLQQGGQLRDQFALAGVAADDMGKTMRTAAKDMVVSVASVAKAFGDLLVGAFIDTSKGIITMVGNVTGLNDRLEKLRYNLTLGKMAGDEMSATLLRGFNGLATFLTGAFTVAVAASLTMVVALGVALKQVTTEQNELAKTLNLTGAGLGMTVEQTVKFAQSLEGVATTNAISFINELGKVSVTGAENLDKLTKTAVDLEKYGGVALKDTAKAYDDLQNKPFDGLMKLAQATGQVSQETIDLAIELKLAGDDLGLLQLANAEFVRANDAAVASIKAEINPMTALWLAIKEGIVFAWEGLKNFARTGAVLETVVGVFRAIAKHVVSVYTGVQILGKTLAGLMQVAVNVRDAINPFSGVSVAEAARNISSVFDSYTSDLNALSAADAAAKQKIDGNTEKTIGLTAEAKAANADYATSTMRGMKELEKAHGAIEKAELKKLTRQQAINKAVEDYLKINKRASQTQLDMIREGAGATWDKANKGRTDKTAKQAAKDLETEIDLRNKQLGLLGSFNNELAAIERRREATGDEDQYQKSLMALIELQPIYKERQKEINAAHDLSNKLMGKADMLGKDYYKTLEQIQEFQDSGLYSPEKAEALRQAAYGQTELAKQQLKYVEESTKAYIKYTEESQKSLDSSAMENQKLDERLELLGLTSEEQKYLKIQQQQRNALLSVDLKLTAQIAKIWEDVRQGKLDPFDAMAAQVNAERAAAEERKNINKEVAVQYAEDFMAEMQKIKSGITDSIVTALFEGGKAGSKKLRDVLVSVLRQKVTMVVDVGVNAVMNSLIGGAAGGGGIGSSLLGSAATNLGGSLLGSIPGVGALSGAFSGFTTAATAAAQSLVGLTGTTAQMTSSLVAAGHAAAPGMATGMSVFSAIPGWGWAIAGIAALAGLMSKKATPHAGAGSTFSAASGLQNINLGAANNMGFMANYAKETQGLTDQIAKTLVTALDSTAKSFGTTAGYAVSAAFADDTSKDGAWGQLIIQKLGVGDIVNWGLEEVVGKWAPKEFADGAEGQQQYMNAIAKSARDALKQAIGDVRWAQNMLDALGESPTIEQLSTTIEQINQAQSAITTLGKNIQGFANMTTDAISSLVEASGGAQAFFANMQGFYENFYSDSEKVSHQARDIADALAAVGIAMPKTREEYRKQVEQQLALGSSGSKAAATLLQYASAFASITESQQDLVQAEQDRIETYKDQQRELLNVQISTSEEQMNLYQKFFDFLDGEIKKLYGSVDSTSAMQVRDARAIITKAQQTGVLPDYETLTSAVDAITGSMSSNNYASRFEMERDKLKFAGQLDDLRDTADKNLKSAKNTFDLLKLQLESLDQLTITGSNQLDALYSIEEAIRDVGVGGTGGTGTGGKTPSGANTVGGGTSPASGTGHIPRTEYGADEALTSFEKFKAWYTGLKSNADPSKLMDSGYQVPDWMRVSNYGADDYTDKSLFGSYLFFKNNPQYAADYQQIMDTGRSSYATDGSTLIRSDMSKMPEEIAKYYKANLPDLMAAEGFGLDPVLAYQLYNFGPGQFGLDQKKQSFTEWLQNNKWTDSGIVSNYNLGETAGKGYSNYQLARWDTSTGNIVNVDGKIYTPDGKYVGMASSQQMETIFGSGYKPTSSSLYQNQVGSGNSTEESYYADIKNNMDAAIAAGWSAQQLADAVRDTGASLQDVATAYGIPVSQVRDNLIAGGATDIPAFANGGKYSGGLALVGERGPELINFNQGGYVSNANQTRSMLSNAELCEKLAVLNERMEKINVETQATALAVIKVSKLLDRVSPDGQSLNVNVI